MITIRVERTNQEQTLPLSNPFVLKAVAALMLYPSALQTVDMGIKLFLPDNKVLIAENVHPNINVVKAFLDKEALHILIMPFQIISNIEIPKGTDIVRLSICEGMNCSARFIEIVDGKLVRYGDSQSAG
jgi:hypothetical protein